MRKIKVWEENGPFVKYEERISRGGAEEDEEEKRRFHTKPQRYSKGTKEDFGCEGGK